MLAALSASERQELLAAAWARNFRRNEVVCRAGDPADSLHLVESGHLAVRGSLASGATATINILSAGDYFGELALLRDDRRRTATVVAIEPSRTLSIAATTFTRLRANNPLVERALSILLADRVDQLSRRLLEMMYLSLDRRIYRRLIELAISYGAVDNRASIPLSQASLADLVGATRPSVNQVLRRLARQRLVSVHRGRIDLLDIAALSGRCGD
ncbi:Crp/Fnr family transcriptional regulator [Kribbella sp. NBC_00359]|uniref:Crp/Fnr family transcriptional regulator n=1 Tax=Kribbella sp. NBC_00359 TaxID=2975966 RepID=UPI002E23AA43